MPLLVIKRAPVNSINNNITPYRGFCFSLSFVIHHMTTSHSFADLYQEKITPEEQREMNNDHDIQYHEEPPFTHKETGAFPPVSEPIRDTVIWWNNIDWDLQRERARGGVNNVGLVLALIGQKLNDLGRFLAEV